MLGSRRSKSADGVKAVVCGRTEKERGLGVRCALQLLTAAIRSRSVRPNYYVVCTCSGLVDFTIALCKQARKTEGTAVSTT